MPLNLSLKRVPDELAARLRERAKQNRRSLQGELLAILEEALKPQRLTVEEVYRRVKGLGLTTGPESVAMVREDRNAR